MHMVKVRGWGRMRIMVRVRVEIGAMAIIGWGQGQGSNAAPHAGGARCEQPYAAILYDDAPAWHGRKA